MMKDNNEIGPMEGGNEWVAPPYHTGAVPKDTTDLVRGIATIRTTIYRLEKRW